MTQSDGKTDNDEYFLGDYSIAGKAEADQTSRYTNRQCAFYCYKSDSSPDFKVTPFTLKKDSASIHVIPSEEQDKLESNYFGLIQTCSGNRIEYIMEPGKINVVGSVYCRNGEPSIEMNRKINRIIIAKKSLDEANEKFAGSARNYLIAAVVLGVICISLVVTGIVLG